MTVNQLIVVDGAIPKLSIQVNTYVDGVTPSSIDFELVQVYNQGNLLVDVTTDVETFSVKIINPCKDSGTVVHDLEIPKAHLEPISRYNQLIPLIYHFDPTGSGTESLDVLFGFNFNRMTAANGLSV